jgi:acetyl-CoA acetyltransferase
MSWITGVGLTRYGKQPESNTLDLMSEAATQAIQDAGLERRDIDGLVCGYSTTLPHLMIGTVFAEHFGLQPAYAHSVQMGGATGFGMAMLAHELVQAGTVKNILVVAGENRLSGQSRDSTVQTLAQVGHPRYEVPLGPIIPAYYALLAARYMHEFSIDSAGLAEFAVLMRQHAAMHPQAHLVDRITVEDVLASKPIAMPLRMMDCCPVSDGGAAFVVSRLRTNSHGVKVIGAGQAHRHQHISALQDISATGASEAMSRALLQAGVKADDARYLAIYDSFTITLCMLLEEIGIAPRGGAPDMVREGRFHFDGTLPLNTHGGLLSFGHCGVAGALAHLVETHLQMTGRAGARQVKDTSLALLHGDGGVLSSHVSLILEQAA